MLATAGSLNCLLGVGGISRVNRPGLSGEVIPSCL